MNIGRQVSRGVFWVGVSTLTAQGLAFVTSLILMRILPRSDFGMLAFATLGIGALQLFREFGLSGALVYRKDRVRQAADTMFVLLVLVSIVLYLVAVVAAVPIASFFLPGQEQLAERQQLVDILRFLSLIMILGSLGQVPLTMLQKEMDFRKRLLPDIVPEVVKDIATITMALNGFGVWSLVYGQFIDVLLTAAMAWVVAPLRPGFRFHPDIAREMIDYGKHLQGFQILAFILQNLDYAFIGRLRGQVDLGVYSRAFTLSNLPATQITRLVGQVMFPALSRLRDSKQDMRRVFLRAVKYTSLFSIPLGVGIFVFSPPFMDILYGAKWHDAITPMQLLVVYGVIRSIAGNMGEVFKAGGKPQWLLGIAAWRMITMLVLLYPATVYFGIVGVSALSAAVAVVDFIVSTALVNRIAKTGFGDFARILAPIFAMSFLAVLAARLVFGLAYGIYPPFALALAGVSMIVVYAALVLTLDGEARQRIIGLIGEIPVGSRLLQAAGISVPAVAPADDV